jgi:Nucleotidyltransferase/DNA polymerase involved in DNA repair
MNGFYASVSSLYHPEYRGKPLAVGGDADKRHGIILASNQEAKKYNIKTAEPIWQAKAKCPHLIICPPEYDLYVKFSNHVRKIFLEYTDLVEPFGLDEAWLDVTNSKWLFGDGVKIANEIRERIKSELGITASVGVSYNKIFAKLGSDYKKPDATTIISRENKDEIVNPLPVENLLYVGRATKQKFDRYGIYTIGDLAKQNVEELQKLYGQNGRLLWKFANGYDNSPVCKWGSQPAQKSISNSTTTCKDIEGYADAEIVLYVLAESVAASMRKQHVACRKISVYFRDTELKSTIRQCTLDEVSQSAEVILKQAMRLLRANYKFEIPLRSIGICASNFEPELTSKQLSLFGEDKFSTKQLELEKTIDEIRERFGFKVVKRGLMLVDMELSDFNPSRENILPTTTVK